MRRTIRTILYQLIGVPLLLAAAWLNVVPAHAEDTPFISIVTGLAPDDLLNIRAKPSPIGKTEARVAAGASVRNLGCNEIDGRPWCKVVSDNPKATGWTPARYLVPVNPAIVSVEDQPTDAPVVASVGDGGQPQDTAAAPAPAVSAAAPAAEAVTPPAPAAAPPVDLTERLGGQGAPKSATSIGQTAMQDAYRLAFAANENPLTGEIPTAGAPAAEALVTEASKAPDPAAQAADPAAAANAEAAPVPAPGIPYPTPRPDQAKAAAETQTVARVEPPQPLAHADTTGDIPCARYVGQPMTRCQISVARGGADKADITVTWPDGGTRVISFYAGMPAGSDSSSGFRFTREGSLSMIRVGVSERFEITDALAFGD